MSEVWRISAHLRPGWRFNSFIKLSEQSPIPGLSHSAMEHCFLSRDPLILIRVFNVYARSIAEYCSPVWSLTAVIQINKIASVQRWFTKQIKSLSNLTYDERLIQLSNDRLEPRRLRADFLMCYKILHHSVDLYQEDFFTMSNIIKTRGNS